ncbi:MAG: ATP-dependent DNA helicase RecG [Burkholderiaceae bacterium]|jgi:ATP-dependent DNA helicase RecG|nr:ATP-dependent DNA helicase RecG [Burkholderiaceae bacterium]
MPAFVPATRNTGQVAPERLSAPQKALRQLGLTRDIDLALHLPLRYEDETRITRLANARLGEPVQFEGAVTHQEVAVRGRRQLLVMVDDGSATCLLRFFHFYPAQLKQMAVGARLRVRGDLRGGPGALTMMHPVVHAAGGELSSALTPVYPAAAGLPQAYLRKAVAAGLARADLSETIAPECLNLIPALHACSLKEALSFLHHPAPSQSALALEDRNHPAWQRLKAEELLAQQLSQLAARRERAHLQAPALAARPDESSDSLPAQLLAALPFTLTGAQRRAVREIETDLAAPRPMQRLLQGDVGAGKTVVAALAAALAINAGWQCALMAPTEILTGQHFSKLAGWLEPLLAPLGQRVVWLTGSQKKKERAAQLTAIESGQAALVVGTHAVIGEQVRFARLGLAVIDEQHRFGVQQRLELRRKLSDQGAALAREPHFLMMSATPIPRTLAMSYYADLDVSTLDELPPGRTPVVTKLVHERRRAEVIAHLRGWTETGRQIYWVCPLIDSPDDDQPGTSPPTPSAQELRAAIETQAELAAALPGREVGLLHSRLPPAEKKTVMARFAAAELPVLVATTVIEVGVDVPNASVMVIEHAERFGLAQLHQLRGRVGRGATASACVLLYGSPDGAPLGAAARQRLQAMRETHDGFEIARRDLAIRGPGEFLGARQSGAALLRFADLTEGDLILAWARRAAPIMLDRYPALAHRHVQRWLGGRADYLKA